MQNYDQGNKYGEYLKHVIFKHKCLTHHTVTPADAVVKSLKDIKNALCGYLPQNKHQMEALKHLYEFFTTTTSTTMATRGILTDAAYTTVYVRELD